MKYQYQTNGMVCTKQIDFELNNGVVSNVVFHGGCPGNLLAISKLIEGKQANEIIRTLKGNPCGAKKTSCTDQLAIALEKSLQEQ